MCEKRPSTPGLWRQTSDGVYLNDIYYPGSGELPVWYDWHKVLLPLARDLRDGTNIALTAEEFEPLSAQQYLPLEPSMLESS